MEAIQPPTDAASNSGNMQPRGQKDQHTDNVSQVADEHLCDNPSLVANLYQSRGINPLRTIRFLKIWFFND